MNQKKNPLGKKKMTKNENVVTFLQLKVSESYDSETFVTTVNVELTMYTDIHQEKCLLF